MWIGELTDKVLDDLRAEVKEAGERAEPWQRAMKPGDHYVLYEPTIDLWVYGRVLQATDPDDAEAFPSIGPIRLAEAFSEGCVAGENGIVHVADMHAPISARAFAEARARRWPNDGSFVTALVMVGGFDGAR